MTDDLGATPVVLYTVRELYEAQAIHDSLEAEGIPSRVEGEFLTSVLGEVPVGDNSVPRVMVRQEDEVAARVVLDRLIAEFRAAQAAEPSDQVCLSCGANMNDSDKCPKCGWTFRTSTDDIA